MIDRIWPITFISHVLARMQAYIRLTGCNSHGGLVSTN